MNDLCNADIVRASDLLDQLTDEEIARVRQLVVTAARRVRFSSDPSTSARVVATSQRRNDPTLAAWLWILWTTSNEYLTVVCHADD